MTTETPPAKAAGLRRRIAELEAQLATEAGAAKTQAALYEIADLAGRAADMQEFYRGIHAILGTLLYAEKVLGVLREYHAAMGELIVEHGGTLEHFAGDGMMVFFNDPVLQDDHVLRAVRMAIAMRRRFDELAAAWAKRGNELGFGIGIATGYATLGRIGFEGRYDYGMVGTSVIVASRLSSAAAAGQILLAPQAHAAVEDVVVVEDLGTVQLKGFSRPTMVVNVVGLRDAGPIAVSG